MDVVKDSLLASAHPEGQGNIASLTLVPVDSETGSPLRIYSASEYSISSDLARRMFRVTPKATMVTNPKLQDLTALFLSLAQSLRSTAISKVSVPTTYSTKALKSVVLAPMESASYFVHQLASEEGAFLSSEELGKRFKS